MTQKNEEFQKYKAMLDKTISAVEVMRDRAKEEMVACCTESGDLLDLRDTYACLTGDFSDAHAALMRARGRAGSIDGGGVIRGGGT